MMTYRKTLMDESEDDEEGRKRALAKGIEEQWKEECHLL